MCASLTVSLPCCYLVLVRDVTDSKFLSLWFPLGFTVGAVHPMGLSSIITRNSSAALKTLGTVLIHPPLFPQT